MSRPTRRLRPVQLYFQKSLLRRHPAYPLPHISNTYGNKCSEGLLVDCTVVALSGGIEPVWLGELVQSNVALKAQEAASSSDWI